MHTEAPQRSLGFSPFEMLYGRTVRGPVTILRELGTKQEEKEEVKTSYQYALDLQNRLEETCKFAKESLAVTGDTQRRHFNKKARKRQLEVGDRALLLLPTDHNKFLMQRKGPFVVTEKVGQNDYRWYVHGKPRTFHINLIRKYVEREGQVVPAGARGDQAAEAAAVIDGGPRWRGCSTPQLPQARLRSGGQREDVPSATRQPEAYQA